MSILSRFRSKYADVAPRIKEVTDPASGVVIQELLADGSEKLDRTPIAPPIGYQRQVPLHLQIREMVRSEALRQAAEAAGAETFEEADDFEVDDDYDPTTPYENDFDPPLKDVREDVEQERKARSKAQEKSVADDKSASGIPPAKPEGSAEPKNGSTTEE